MNIIVLGPLVAYYGPRDLVIEIDGARSIDEVQWDVDAALGLEGVR